jgi:Putative addiction module component
MQLDPIEREILLEELLVSLWDENRQEIDKAWLKEVKRREKQHAESGEIGKPVNEVIARLIGQSRRKQDGHYD